MMEVLSPNKETKMRDQFQPGAFVGSIFITSGILDTANVYHGVSGCHAMAQHFRGDLLPNGGYVPIVGTGFLETEAIMGGAAKLVKTLRQVAEAKLVKEVPQCIWISMSDCPAVSGEDIEGVSKGVAADTGVKIVAIENAGFKGGLVRGAELALCKILDEVVEPYDGKREGINLIAPFLMGSANWPFDIDHIVEMLEAAGVKVNLVLSRNLNFADLQRFPAAEANLLLGYDEMPDFVGKSDSIGVPTLTDDLALPFGIGNTEEWLLNLAERFGDSKKAQRYLLDEMNSVKKILHRNYNFSWMASFLSDKYAAVCGYAPFAAAMTRYLFHDLNIRVKVVGLWSETDAGIQKAEKVLEPLSDSLDFTVLENPTYLQLGEAAKQANVDFAIGSIQDKPLFKSYGIAHLNLGGFYYFNNYNFVPWPLVGVKGSLRLFSEICKVVDDAFYETEAWKKLAFVPGEARD
ncbi:MAG: Oxidored nitro domain-containing protein [Deltaproteobacteria bacterium]|nr:Oxidored nitro domain-containing protein [Deltaproteobacteria bacterium]